jgi:hypothetical protein
LSTKELNIFWGWLWWALEIWGELFRRRKPSLLQPVFLPDQHEKGAVEEGEEGEPQAVGVAEPVALIEDEARERREREGIGPGRLARQAKDEDELHQPVAQKIDGIEMLRTHRELAGDVKQRGGHGIAMIMQKLALRDGVDKGLDVARVRHRQKQAAKAFDDGIDGLERQAGMEQLVDEEVFQGCSGKRRDKGPSIHPP